ncbi:condensation domain-containing protein [Streptomyces coryli]|uniref:condensation domain-containing protein n=1 Tax=Streptomyces coryli TaxID=1128680 RepID=UPI0030B8BBA4
MRTELSPVAGRTAQVTALPVSDEPAGEGPATWGQWAIRRAMLDMEPDDHGTNVRVLHPVSPPVPPQTALAAVRGLLTVHDSLRTRVVIDADGAMRQHLDGDGSLDAYVFEAADAAEAAALTAEIDRQWHAVRFDCATEWPIRAALVLVGGEVAYIALTLSHIASDALGLSRVDRTLTALLGGADAAALRKAAADFQPLDEAAYQASAKGQKRDLAARRHWRETLERCPTRLFTRRPDAPPAFRQGVLASPTLPGALEALSDRWRVNASAILLAAASAVVARQAGTDRCALQVMVSNRFLPGLRDTVSPITLEGLFALDCGGEDGDGGFEALARRASRAAMKTYYHSYYDKSALLPDLHATDADLTCWYNDLRDMTWHTRTVDDRERRPGAVADSVIEWEPAGQQSQTSLAWHIYSSAYLMPVTLTVDTSLIDEPAAEAMLRDFESLITREAAA